MKIILSPLAEFNFKKLSKKYKNLTSDLNNFIDDVKYDRPIKSDLMQGYPIALYKSRVKNSSNNKGKSGGFRVIYHLKINDILYILAIYSKSDRGNVDKKEVLKSLKSLGIN